MVRERLRGRESTVKALDLQHWKEERSTMNCTSSGTEVGEGNAYKELGFLVGPAKCAKTG